MLRVEQGKNGLGKKDSAAWCFSAPAPTTASEFNTEGKHGHRSGQKLTDDAHGTLLSEAGDYVLRLCKREATMSVECGVQANLSDRVARSKTQTAVWLAS